MPRSWSFTAPVVAGALIVGYAVAVASGSRPLGGLVILLGGLWCVRAWLALHDRFTALLLTGVALLAFAASHVLALVVGAWPAVLLAAAIAGIATWRRADARGPAV